VKHCPMAISNRFLRMQYYHIWVINLVLLN
jgi:hypothetical protein